MPGSEARALFRQLMGRNGVLGALLVRADVPESRKAEARAEMERNREQMKRCGKVWSEYRKRASQDYAEDRRQARER